MIPFIIGAAVSASIWIPLGVAIGVRIRRPDFPTLYNRRLRK